MFSPPLHGFRFSYEEMPAEGTCCNPKGRLQVQVLHAADHLGPSVRSHTAPRMAYMEVGSQQSRGPRLERTLSEKHGRSTGTPDVMQPGLRSRYVPAWGSQCANEPDPPTSPCLLIPCAPGPACFLWGAFYIAWEPLAGPSLTGVAAMDGHDGQCGAAHPSRKAMRSATPDDLPIGSFGLRCAFCRSRWHFTGSCPLLHGQVLARAYTQQ